MIPGVYEKMWKDKLRWWYGDIVLTRRSDYKFIELLDDYYILYICGHDEDNELYE
jgi:hypothetical protein